MPWCEPCSRYFAPSSMTVDGTCPDCGQVVHVPRIGKGESPTLSELSKMSGEKAPWHFKLLMWTLVLYLGWRIIAPFVD